MKQTPVFLLVASLFDGFPRLFVESLTGLLSSLRRNAAGIGLTITAANHVIHLSRWWNLAVEDQCNDRAFRIGQTKDVMIHLPMAIHPRHKAGSFDQRLHDLLERKRALSKDMLAPPSSDKDVDGLFAEVVG